MLRFRLIVAALLIIPIVGLLAADFQLTPQAPGAILYPFGAIVVMLGAHELSVLLSRGGYTHSYPAAMLGAGLVWISGAIVVYYPFTGEPYPVDCPLGKLGWPLGAQAVALMVAFTPAILRYEDDSKKALGAVAASAFPSVYLALPTSFFIWLRLYGENGWGLTALISVITIVKLSDVGAYTFGKTLGKRKLAPVLSPKKTVEGAVGGLLTAAVASILFFQIAPPQLAGASSDFTVAGIGLAAVYGIVLGAVGIIGDLAESLIKRDVGAKDSGVLPGLGGFLDILDSMIFAAPIAYLCWVIGIVGPKTLL